MRADIRPTAWHSRPASSISAARRRHRTSARRRRCWPTWRRCTRCSTGRADCVRLRNASTASRHHSTARWRRLVTARPTRRTSIRFAIERADLSGIRKAAEAAGINFRYSDDAIGISLDETTTVDDLKDVVAVFASVAGQKRRRRVQGSMPRCAQGTRRVAAHERVPDAPGLQLASLRNEDDALHPQRSSARTSASTRR